MTAISSPNDLQRIIAFLKGNRVLSLCSVRGSQPWAANLFYAFDAEVMALLFMSDAETRHGREMTENPRVAGTISTQQSEIGRLRGVQFTGRVSRAETGMALYIARFPIAALRPAPLWSVRLDAVKFTDNTLGFGTKLSWQRPGQSA